MAPSDAGASAAGLPVRTGVVYLLLFAAAIGAYAVAWPRAPVLEGDSAQYLAVAEDLADLRVDALHDRTPGYPLLLALTGAAPQPSRALFFVSLLLHCASVWLLAIVLRAHGVHPRWLIVFCCLLLLPPYVEPAAQVMTETLAQFTLAAGFASLVLWLQSRRSVLLVASVVAFGYAALTRPAYQALTAALAGALLVLAAALPHAALRMPRAAATGAALVAGSLLLVGTVASVNYARFGYFGLTPSLGLHLSTKTMGFVERLPDEYASVREILVRERDVQLTERGGTHTGTQTIWSVRPELAAATGLTSRPALSRYLLKMNLTLIRRAPLEYLQEVARSMALYWFPASGGLASMDSSLLRALWWGLHLLLVCVFFGEIVVLTGAAAFAASAHGWSWMRETVASTGERAGQLVSYGLAAAIVFYTMLLSCAIDIGEARQRRSTDALIIFMCFLGIHLWAVLAGDVRRAGVRDEGPDGRHRAVGGEQSI